MISVVIPTLNAAPTITRALAPLVSGVADGLVKECIIVDGASADETRDMAEAAGCTLIAGAQGRAKQLIAGAKAARGAWLLFLHQNTALEPQWLDETHRFVTRTDQRAAVFRLAQDDGGALRPALIANLLAPRGEQGLLIARKLYDEIGGYRDVAGEDADIIRRLGAARLARFKTLIVKRA